MLGFACNNFSRVDVHNAFQAFQKFFSLFLGLFPKLGLNPESFPFFKL